MASENHSQSVFSVQGETRFSLHCLVSFPISDARINSAIEIARKMEDAEFIRKLKVYGFVEEVYTKFRAIKAGEGDIVSRTRNVFSSSIVKAYLSHACLVPLPDTGHLPTAFPALAFVR
jgi:hypothetical protein